MNLFVLDKLVDRVLLEEAKKIRTQKGINYSDKDDTLDNFKKIATLLNLTPLQVWAVYFIKHILALLSVVKGTHVDDGESIESRFCDILNYLFLGFGLMVEVKPYKMLPSTRAYIDVLMKQYKQFKEILSPKKDDKN